MTESVWNLKFLTLQYLQLLWDSELNSEWHSGFETYNLKLKTDNLQLKANSAIGMERLLELFVSLWTKATRESPTCNEMEGIAQFIQFF